MFEMVVEALRRRLYPISFLLRSAKTKLRGPIAVTNVDWMEDQAVNQRLSGVFQSVPDYRHHKRTL